MKTKNPFSTNPLTSLPELKLIPVPATPETHEKRQPLRSYLNPSGASGGLSALLDGLSGSPRPMKKIEVEKRVSVPAVPTTSPEDEDEAPVYPSRRRR
jgi:hypothetical protein